MTEEMPINGQKPGADDEEEGELDEEEQLTRDVQQKYGLSGERVNKLLKNAGKTMKKPHSPEPQVIDELASLTIEDEVRNAEIGERAVKYDGLDNDTTRADREPKMWRTKFTLKSHLDKVRSVAFHQSEMLVASGSDDTTVKLWNLKSLVGKKPAPQDIEPSITYRGHSNTVTSVVIASEQGRVYSAGLDSTIRVWKIPAETRETYAPVDPSLNLSSYIGHTDTIWDLKSFPLSDGSTPQSNILVSASADGTVKVWDTELKGSPLRNSWSFGGLGVVSNGVTSSQAAPTSLTFLPTDLRKLAASFTNSLTNVYDLETGQLVASFKSDETYDGTPLTQINAIVAHPTMPLLVTGHEDRYIRFLDLREEKVVFSMVGHLDGVTTMDVESTGLVLVSGGHDSSVRLWDISSTNRTCIQEFTGHRRKGDEGVLSVRYHPALPWMVSGGADGIVKVYQHGVH